MVNADWQGQRTMTARQFKAVIREMGMSQAGAGRFIGVSERTAHRMVSGETEVPASVALLLRSMLAHKERPIVPAWEG